jgi:hypothetical protein
MINKVHLLYKNQSMFIVCQKLTDLEVDLSIQDNQLFMLILASNQIQEKELVSVLAIKDNSQIGCKKI